MKNTLWAGLLILIFSASLIGCGPASIASTSFAGTWTTNLGIINFVQNGNEITGNIDGYGKNWNETFTGVINENSEAVFETEVLGNFTLILNNNTFRSTNNELSFCGVRGENMELPTGCGFSGKWIATSKYLKNEGYLILTQVGPDVTGDMYNAMGEKYETFKGTVDWGKGWRANGITIQRGELSLWINAAETGFELVYGESGNPQQVCAVREGIESAYLSYFTCEP